MASNLPALQANNDIFLMQIQGPVVQVTVVQVAVSLTITPHTYTLPRALLWACSNFFRDARTNMGALPDRIEILNVDPAVFGLFLRFIYQSQYPAQIERGGSQHVPPSICAWTLGRSLGAVDFVNHAMAHVYNGLGKSWSITPKIVDWVFQHTSSTCALQRFIIDALIQHWGRNNAVVNGGVIFNQEWDDLFARIKELRVLYTLGFGVNRGHIGGFEKYATILGQGQMYGWGVMEARIENSIEEGGAFHQQVMDLR